MRELETFGWAIVTEGGNIRIWWRDKPTEYHLLSGEQLLPLRPLDAVRGSMFGEASRELAAERYRQIKQEGWSHEYDDQLVNFQLAHIAMRYVEHASRPDKTRRAREKRGPNALRPFNEDWFKPTNRRRDLVKAGALILAEIERLDRAAVRGASS